MAEEKQDETVHWATAINKRLKPYSELAETLKKLGQAVAWFYGAFIAIAVVATTWITIEMPSHAMRAYQSLIFPYALLVAVSLHSRKTAERMFKGGLIGLTYSAAPIFFALGTGTAVCVAVQQSGDMRVVWLANTVVAFMVFGWSIFSIITGLFHIVMTVTTGGIIALLSDLPIIIDRQVAIIRARDESESVPAPLESRQGPPRE